MKNKIIGILALAVLVFAAIPVFPASKGKDEARSEWMGGFVKMEAADKAESNSIAALDLYKEALAVFENVRRKYPQWNPSLLNYRINYCQQKIQEHSRKVEAGTNTLTAEELLELNKTQARKLQELESGNKELNSRVAFLTESLQRARSEAAKGSSLETTAAALAAAKSNLEKSAGELELKLRNTEEKLKKLQEQSGNLNKIQKELARCKEKLEASEKGLDSANKEINNLKKLQNQANLEIRNLNRVKEDGEAALRISEELANARKAEIEKLKNTKAGYEAQLETAAKNLEGRERELGRLQDNMAGKEAEILELKRLREADAELLAGYRKGQETLGATEKELKNLNDELAALKLLQEKTAKESAEKDAHIARLLKSVEQERANALGKNEKYLELTAEAAKLKKLNELAEEQNLRLSNQLKETQIVLGKVREDSADNRKSVESAVERDKELQELRRQLNENIALAQKQEVQLNQQKNKIEEMTAQVAENKKRQDEELKREAGKTQTAELKYRAEIAELKAEIGTYLDENQKNKTTVNQVNMELAEAKTQLENLNKQKNQAQEQIRELSANLEVMRQTANKYSTAAEKLPETEKALEEARKTAETAAINSKKIIDEMIEKSRKQNREMEMMLDKIHALENTIAHNNEDFMKQNSSLQEKSREELAVIKTNQELIGKLRSDLQETEKKNQQLQSSNSRLDEEILALKQKIAEFTENERLLAARNMAGDGLTKNLAEKENTIRSLNERLETAILQLKNFREQAAEDAKLNDELGAQSLNERIQKRNKVYETQIQHLKDQLRGKDEILEKLKGGLKSDAGLLEEIVALHKKLETASADNNKLNLDIISQKEDFDRQIKDKDDTIERMKQNQTTDVRLVEKLAEANDALDKEIKKRKMLEETLIDLDNKAQSNDVKTAPQSREQAGSHVKQLELRFSREHERQVLVKGFLRQGADSEKQGNIEAAKFNYMKALELDGDNRYALQRMGIIAANLGSDLEAVKFLKQAFKFDPDDMDTLVALGYSQARLGQPDWAVSYLGRAAALNPDDSNVARAYGSALFTMGWTQAAEERLLTAYNLNKKDSEAPFNLAVLFATARPARLQEAAKWYKIAIDNGAQRDPGLDRALNMNP